jgi:hypothetical protein
MNNPVPGPDPIAGLADLNPAPPAFVMEAGIQDNPLREGPREEVTKGIRPDRATMRLELDPARERLHAGAALIDPFDISDLMEVYAPTNGDPKKNNWMNEIDFNWKRFETYGKKDFPEQRHYHHQGWRPVLHSHFPGRFAPEGTEGPVIIKDQILMERPMRLTVQARQDEMRQATQMMRVNRENLGATPEGQAPRMVLADRTSREAIEIPE